MFTNKRNTPPVKGDATDTSVAPKAWPTSAERGDWSAYLSKVVDPIVDLKTWNGPARQEVNPLHDARGEYSDLVIDAGHTEAIQDRQRYVTAYEDAIRALTAETQEALAGTRSGKVKAAI